MKKNKLTNFLKLGVLLFGVLLLWGCERGEIIESDMQVSNNNAQNKTIQNLSLSQLDNEPLFNEVTSFFKIKSILKKSKVEKGKFFLKKAHQGFHIETNDVIKAEKLFETLTKNAVSVTTQPSGAIVANMGNGNYITYRTISQSTSGFEASINLNFPNIWTNARVLKFQ